MTGAGSEAAAPAPARAEQATVRLVVFVIAGEVHGLPVAAVEEVVVDRPIHHLPDMPPNMLGMLSLRGTLVPVLDPAGRLGLRKTSTGRPAVLILQQGTQRMGLAADEVLEVVHVPEEHMPQSGGAVTAERLVVGIVRTPQRLITLLNPVHLWAGPGPLQTEDAT